MGVHEEKFARGFASRSTVLCFGGVGARIAAAGSAEPSHRRSGTSGRVTADAPTRRAARGGRARAEHFRSGADNTLARAVSVRERTLAPSAACALRDR